jgi:hypothetical protein
MYVDADSNGDQDQNTTSDGYVYTPTGLSDRYIHTSARSDANRNATARECFGAFCRIRYVNRGGLERQVR